MRMADPAPPPTTTSILRTASTNTTPRPAPRVRLLVGEEETQTEAETETESVGVGVEEPQREGGGAAVVRWTRAREATAVLASGVGSRLPVASPSRGGGLSPLSMMRECTCKVVVVGEPAAGKTSLIRRFVREEYSRGYKATIGVDFSVKNIIWNDQYLVKLNLWDVGGQNAMNITKVFFRHAVGAVVVYDVTSPVSKERADLWKANVDENTFESHRKPPIPCILVGNKVDLLESAEDVDAERRFLRQKQEELGYHGSFLTSSVTEEGITDAFGFLLETILDSMKSRETFDTEEFTSLEAAPAEVSAQKSCRMCSPSSSS